jgi:hypothetical protein
MNALLPQSYEEFFDHVVPVLQDKGLMQKEYRSGTLREKLFETPTPTSVRGTPPMATAACSAADDPPAQIRLNTTRCRAAALVRLPFGRFRARFH